MLPVDASISQLHAGGEEYLQFSMSPVSGAATSNVQHTGNTSSLVNQNYATWSCEHTYLIHFAMDSLKSITTLLSESEEFLVVIRESVGPAPGEQDQLTVAVDAVVEDPVSLPLQQVVSHMDSLNLRPGLRSMICVTALVIGGTSLIPVESIISVGISSLRKL